MGAIALDAQACRRLLRKKFLFTACAAIVLAASPATGQYTGPRRLPSVYSTARSHQHGSTYDGSSVLQPGPSYPSVDDRATSVAWWEQAIHQRLRNSSPAVEVSLETLIIGALRHSSQVRVFSDLPLIRETAIVEADAAFDWHTFMDTKWSDSSVPVGSTLTTGGPNRYRDNNWSYDAGVRMTNTVGGRFEASQQIGFENTNSLFFQPNNQGRARLTLGYTQPLLRGAGEVYNTSMNVLASIDADIARDEFLRQLQSHLLDITRAYWALYLERGTLLQKQRLAARADALLVELQARSQVDSVSSQIVRTQAAATERRAALLRAETAVRNAEDRIVALVNDPSLSVNRLELVPQDQPTCDAIFVDAQQAVAMALHNRPEVGQAVKQIKAATVRQEISRNELLPTLNAVLETYLSGLRGQSDIGAALGDQFSVGEPSYSAGLLFEVPIGNRAAKARYARRALELRQLQSQFSTTVSTLGLETKVAVREVETSFREVQAKLAAVNGAHAQVNYLEQRWQHLPGENISSAGLYLEDLLSAQERLTAAESGYLEAQTTYSLSLMNLKRAMGTLLQEEQVNMGLACVDGLPMMTVGKAQSGQFGPVVFQEQPYESFNPSQYAPAPTPYIPPAANQYIPAPRPQYSPSHGQYPTTPNPGWLPPEQLPAPQASAYPQTDMSYPTLNAPVAGIRP